MDELIAHLQNLNSPLRCYYLGLAVNSDPASVQTALEQLSVSGVDAYAEQVTQTNQYDCVNYEDVFGNLIVDYSPLDVIIDSGTPAYAFTRPEWPELLKKRLNWYTNQPLSEDTQREIHERLSFCRGFPEAKPVKELLTGALEVKDVQVIELPIPMCGVDMDFASLFPYISLRQIGYNHVVDQ